MTPQYTGSFVLDCSVNLINSGRPAAAGRTLPALDNRNTLDGGNDQ